MSINPIKIDRMFVDHDWTGEENKPDSFETFIPGKRGRIFSNVNCPGGEGPYPVIIICHGLPGNEQMTDFGTTLRHIGFCTITFHYSGSWGSDGKFSISNSMEDVDSVVEYVLRNEKGLFDLKNIFLIGHSMGGFMGTYATAKYREIKAGTLIMPANIGGSYLAAQQSKEAEHHSRRVWDGFGEWLVGFSWDEFSKEADKNLDKFLYATYADKLSQKPVLAIVGTMDVDLPRGENIDLLIAEIRSKGKQNLKELVVPTNHGMSDQRNTIIRAIAEFFSMYIE